MARLDATPPFGPRPGIRPDATDPRPGPADPQPGPAGGDVATGPRANDAKLASAYRDLESAVCDLKCMAALMNTAAEDTVSQGEGFLEKHLREQSNLKGYRILVLTEDQDDGLQYAINHLNDLVRALHAKYYAGWEAKAAS